MANSARISEIERPGVLNRAQIRKLIQDGIISGWDSSKDADIGASSLDLHIGDKFWKLPAGLKCRNGQNVSDLISKATKSTLGMEALKVPESGLSIEIKKDEPCLFELQEAIHLPENFYGQGTGRSTIGRLDVLTRLLVDGEEKYDRINPCKERRLFVEVTPLSFPIKIAKGTPVYQVRICKGDFRKLRIDEDLVKHYSKLMSREDGNPITGIEQSHLRLKLTTIGHGGGGDIIAYKAKKVEFESENVLALDLDAPDKTYEPSPYWEPVTAASEEAKKIDGKIALKVKKDSFYILCSQERLHLPPDIAVYAVAMTEEVGELRIHHAGFVHPGFGSKRKDDRKGTPLIFEVRGHDVNMFLMDGNLMAEIHYYPMSEPVPSEELADPYGGQELKLSKIFKDFDHANRNP
jgi:dCTP deaminase